MIYKNLNQLWICRVKCMWCSFFIKATIISNNYVLYFNGLQPKPVAELTSKSQPTLISPVCLSKGNCCSPPTFYLNFCTNLSKNIMEDFVSLWLPVVIRYVESYNNKRGDDVMEAGEVKSFVRHLDWKSPIQ